MLLIVMLYTGYHKWPGDRAVFTQVSACCLRTLVPSQKLLLLLSNTPRAFLLGNETSLFFLGLFFPLLSFFFFPPELIAAIIVVFILAILYEGLKTLRELLIFRDLKHSKSHTASSTNSQKAALIVNNPAKKGWATLFWFNMFVCSLYAC